MKPIIKYPGGKEKELKYIIPNLPENVDNYYEPFLGGGSVFFALNYNHSFVNDISVELMSMYRYIQQNNELFFDCLKDINNGWRYVSDFVDNNIETLLNLYSNTDGIDNFIDRRHRAINGFLRNNLENYRENFLDTVKTTIKAKIKNTKKVEKRLGKLNKEDKIENIKSGFKASLYTHLRNTYNNIEEYNELKIALYIFLREYCYSSMFRFNSNGEFNVPFGGLSYNEKYLTNKIELMSSNECRNKFNSTTICCEDFYDFMNHHQPQGNDFIFLDPPYDTEFSTYNKNEFTRNDQTRLRDYLVNECNANWMLIIKNTDFIYNLYANQGLNIYSFDKQYIVSFKNRNNKDCEHLLIRNY